MIDKSEFALVPEGTEKIWKILNFFKDERMKRPKTATVPEGILYDAREQLKSVDAYLRGISEMAFILMPKPEIKITNRL